jgi:hypothetical protein
VANKGKSKCFQTIKICWIFLSLPSTISIGPRSERVFIKNYVGRWPSLSSLSSLTLLVPPLLYKKRRGEGPMDKGGGDKI